MKQSPGNIFGPVLTVGFAVLRPMSMDLKPRQNLEEKTDLRQLFHSPSVEITFHGTMRSDDQITD
jgi:hypothetical protein